MSENNNQTQEMDLNHLMQIRREKLFYKNEYRINESF